MYRYISLIWNEADGQAADTARFLANHFMGTETDWSTAYSGKGLRVLHTGEEKGRMQAYPVNPQSEGSGGVVLGKLFDRAKSPEVIPGNAELSVPEARKVVESKGRHLVNDYWGTYVAFFQDETKKYVLVDPIGTFCCFSTQYRGVEIYFTYMPDVADCDFLNFSINWLPIAKQLRYGFEKTETGLREVDKTLPGQCVTISPWNKEKAFYWNPQKISQTDVIEDVEEAEEALRQTLLTTVAAMAAPYDNVFHQLGGLDSSILLACLKEAPTSLEVTCLNVFHDCPMGDERYYARKATAHVDVPLIEYSESTANLHFEEMENTPLTTVPLYYAQQIEFEKSKSYMAQQNGVQATFSGLGGDEILYATAASYSPIDYLHSNGLRPLLLGLIMEAARMQNVSVWSILPKIARDGWKHNRWDLYREIDLGTVTTLNSEIQDLIKPDGAIHPWIEQKYDAPPGKFEHIVPYTKGIYDLECKSTPKEHVPMIYPLLSQPVVEICLRIPSWVMTINGKTRGLARKAFQNYLPADIIWRTSKLSAGSHVKTVIQENQAFFRECLLDGILVSEKIVKKSNLEKTLAMDHDIGSKDHSWLLWYINAEIWARKWRGKRLINISQSNAA